MAVINCVRIFRSENSWMGLGPSQELALDKRLVATFLFLSKVEAGWVVMANLEPTLRVRSISSLGEQLLQKIRSHVHASSSGSTRLRVGLSSLSLQTIIVKPCHYLPRSAVSRMAFETCLSAACVNQPCNLSPPNTAMQLPRYHSDVHSCF